MAYIRDIGNEDVATPSVSGITRMSVAAEDPLNPIAVGDNDPRLDSESTTATTQDQLDELTDNFHRLLLWVACTFRTIPPGLEDEFQIAAAKNL